MSDVADDSTHCPVCFEPYAENGSRLPRLLPCSHTLCHQCVTDLLENNALECPQERKRHPAEDGPLSFPQNKYILKLLKKHSKKDAFPLCKEHGRGETLYCKEEECQKALCQLCMLETHKGHDVVDVIQVVEKMKKTMSDDIEKLAEVINLSKSEILHADVDMILNCRSLIDSLEQIKADQSEMFDKLSSRLDIKLSDLSEVREKILMAKSYDQMNAAKHVLETIRAGLQAELKGSTEYKLYKMFEETRFLSFNSERSKIWIKPTVEEIRRKCCRVNYDSVNAMRVLSDGTLVILGRDNGLGYNWYPESYWNWLKPIRQALNVFSNQKQIRLTQYSLPDLNVLYSKGFTTFPYELAEVRLNGQRCVVISDGSKLSFMDAQDMDRTVHSHLISAYGICAISPTKLLCSSPGSFVTLDCSFLPPKETSWDNTAYEPSNCLCCINEGENSLLISSPRHFNEIHANNMDSGECEWKVSHRQGVTIRRCHAMVTDGSCYIFFQHGSSIDILSRDGTHLGSLVDSVYLEMNELDKIAWDKKTSSLFIVHKNYFEGCFIDEIKVKTN